MLTHIYVKNFVLIDQVALDFSDGMSVFTGETETLKDLGVVMTQANLKAYAMSQGITKSLDSMSQAELVGLRYM